MKTGIVLCKNLSKSNTTDFYQTPYSMVEQFLKVYNIKKGILFDPCCGENAIIDCLKSNGYQNLMYSDINHHLVKTFGKGVETEFATNTDFLSRNFLTGTDLLMYDPFIITNPPYSLANEFIEKASRMVDHFAFLLPLNYLTGLERYEKKLFVDLSYVYVFVRKAMLSTEVRKDGRYKAGMVEYAWFVWEKGNKESTRMYFINNQDYILTSKEKYADLF